MMNSRAPLSDGLQVLLREAPQVAVLVVRLQAGLSLLIPGRWQLPWLLMMLNFFAYVMFSFAPTSLPGEETIASKSHGYARAGHFEPQYLHPSA